LTGELDGPATERRLPSRPNESRFCASQAGDALRLNDAFSQHAMKEESDVADKYVIARDRIPAPSRGPMKKRHEAIFLGCSPDCFVASVCQDGRNRPFASR
jgi:hypothetical protein